MRQHFRAVQATPTETVIWELVEFIPGDFLGRQISAAARFHYLRQRASETERIWQPDVPNIYAKMLLPVVFSMQELPYKRFTRGNHAVRFDPHSTLQFPKAITNRLANLIKQPWHALTNPFVDLRL